MRKVLTAATVLLAVLGLLLVTLAGLTATPVSCLLDAVTVQQVTANVESVAGWYSGTPCCNEPFTVQTIGGTLTILPLI